MSADLTTTTTTTVTDPLNDLPDDLRLIGQKIIDFASSVPESESGSVADSELLPYELTKKERYAIHRFAEKVGVGSRSIALKGSNDKKVELTRTVQSRESDHFDSGDIDVFTGLTKAPFPCTDPDPLDYYIDAFDSMFGTKAAWNLFAREELALRRSKSSVKHQIATAREAICDAIRADPNYAKVTSMRLRGVASAMRKDVYNYGSEDKIFVSLDIKSANFSVCNLICPTVFGGSSWSDFVRKFTTCESVIESKLFREVVFGKLGFTAKARTLQESIMDVVHNHLSETPEISAFINADTMRMKAGDENVYEVAGVAGVTALAKFCELIDTIGKTMCNIKIRDIPVLKRIYEETGRGADVDAETGDAVLGDIFHIRVFRVNQFETKKYFVKNFIYRSDWSDDIDYMSLARGGSCPNFDELPLHKRVEFKRVEKKFYLQVLKRFQKLPIDDNDLFFVDSGVKAKFCHTIFD